MSINLRRRQRTVTEHFLHNADIGSAVEHVRCKRVSKCVGTDRFSDRAVFHQPLSDDEMNSARRQPLSFAVDQQRLIFFPSVRPFVSAPKQGIVTVRFLTETAEADHSLLPSLSDNCHRIASSSKITVVHGDDFADSATGRIEQFKEKSIS